MFFIYNVFMESNGKNFPLLFLWLKVYNFQKNVTNI